MESLGLAMYSTLVPSVYCCFYCPKVFPFANIGEVLSESRIVYTYYMYGSYYYVDPANTQIVPVFKFFHEIGNICQPNFILVKKNSLVSKN